RRRLHSLSRAAVGGDDAAGRLVPRVLPAHQSLSFADRADSLAGVPADASAQFRLLPVVQPPTPACWPRVARAVQVANDRRRLLLSPGPPLHRLEPGARRAW